MGCVRTLCEDLLRLLSLIYIAAGIALLWAAFLLIKPLAPRELLHVQSYWYPELIAVLGVVLLLSGIVSAVGAWASHAPSINWFAGASFVTLVVQAMGVLAYLDDGSAFERASKHDKTKGLAKTLHWIDDNSTAFIVLLYAALIAQALGALSSTCRATCCSGRRPDRYSRGYTADEREYQPLLPQTYTPGYNAGYKAGLSARSPVRDSRGPTSKRVPSPYQSPNRS
ncbi:hypothetical protein WJX73_007218 [Symbiochloris irregularis]|uniref:Uncharacterized protein n=1 Tax=Symbiochloris irregularis TaxID=706552 RepID=A0AAW1P7B2_9CHLO